MKEKKEKCLLCDRFIMARKFNIRTWYRDDTVHIKGDLFGRYLDVVVHKHCFKKFSSIGESGG